MKVEAVKHAEAGFRICPELWYVIGAVLGDGYLFRSRERYLVGLDVRSEGFAARYASKMSRVIRRPVKARYYAGGRIWFVRVGNHELFCLVRQAREKPNTLTSLVRRGSFKQNSFEFLAGLFDAEGCVKVVKEESRRTAKLCLDITNTSKELLDIANSLMEESLGFAGRFSLQEDAARNRKPVFHLRVYRKKDVQKFLVRVRTVKFTPAKRKLLRVWLSVG